MSKFKVTIAVIGFTLFAVRAWADTEPAWASVMSRLYFADTGLESPLLHNPVVCNVEKGIETATAGDPNVPPTTTLTDDNGVVLTDSNGNPIIVSHRFQLKYKQLSECYERFGPNNYGTVEYKGNLSPDSSAKDKGSNDRGAWPKATKVICWSINPKSHAYTCREYTDPSIGGGVAGGGVNVVGYQCAYDYYHETGNMRLSEAYTIKFDPALNTFFPGTIPPPAYPPPGFFSCAEQAMAAAQCWAYSGTDYNDLKCYCETGDWSHPYKYLALNRVWSWCPNTGAEGYYFDNNVAGWLYGFPVANTYISWK